MSNQFTENNRLPTAPLKIAALEGCRDLTEKVDACPVRMRASGAEVTDERRRSLHYRGYDADSYLLSINCPRFSTGEGKSVIDESVCDADLFVMVDVANYSLTYKVDGNENHISSDDHFQGLKHIIATGDAAAHCVNVIMPLLYEGRQHRRTKRESLDYAYILTKLANMGIEDFITFDARDPCVQNATPLSGFDNFIPTYQFIRTYFLNIPDMKADESYLMAINPGEGAMNRAVCTSNIFGVDIGIFYKCHDYSEVIDGRNPIIAHGFLGASVEGRDVLIIDDMISSGGSMMDTAKNLKNRGRKRIIVCAIFGLFMNGVKNFREKYDAGVTDYVYTTNLNYCRPELLEEPWYLEADMSPYLAYIIDNLNTDASSGDKLSLTREIQDFLENLQNKEYQYLGSIIK